MDQSLICCLEYTGWYNNCLLWLGDYYRNKMILHLFFSCRLIIKVSATKEVFIKLFQVIGRSSIFTKEVHEWFLMESTHNYIRCSSHMVSMNQRSLLETCSESHLSFHIGMVNTVFCIWDTHLFFCYLLADHVLIYFFYEKINIHSRML